MMDPLSIETLLKEQFSEGILSSDLESFDPWIEVDVRYWLEIAKFFIQDQRLSFDSLMCLSGVDYTDQLGCVYHLHSMRHNHRITIKIFMSYDKPEIPSVSSLWKTADWHEREAYDLFGIVFLNHPDLRRILLPDDWEGYPLRKNYQTPVLYQDIKIRYEDRVEP